MQRNDALLQHTASPPRPNARGAPGPRGRGRAGDARSGGAGRVGGRGRRRGAVLLVNEAFDELPELVDRLVAMFEAAFIKETPAGTADVQTIGSHMGGHN